jgi:hypothetical protein
MVSSVSISPAFVFPCRPAGITLLVSFHRKLEEIQKPRFSMGLNGCKYNTLKNSNFFGLSTKSSCTQFAAAYVASGGYRHQLLPCQKQTVN